MILNAGVTKLGLIKTISIKHLALVSLIIRLIQMLVLKITFTNK